MGYIPIIIAVLAFAVLLILVNMSSIQARQHSLGLALFSVCQTAKSRHALLNRLSGIHTNLLCPTLPSDHRLLPEMFPQINAFLKAEWKSLEEANIYAETDSAAQDTKRYLTALQVLNHRQRTNLRTFERKVREYNLLINTYPTAFVAILYRLKPINLSSAPR